MKDLAKTIIPVKRASDVDIYLMKDSSDHELEEELEIDEEDEGKSFIPNGTLPFS